MTDPVIVEISGSAKEPNAIAVEVKTNQGSVHWLRFTEGAALRMVGVLSRLISSSQSQDRMTLTVSGSQSLARADGRKAILLMTQELGPIAFELPEGAIPLLQRQLADLQAVQQSPSSH
jgi:hypothetical protein